MFAFASLRHPLYPPISVGPSPRRVNLNRPLPLLASYRLSWGDKSLLTKIWRKCLGETVRVSSRRVLASPLKAPRREAFFLGGLGRPRAAGELHAGSQGLLTRHNLRLHALQQVSQPSTRFIAYGCTFVLHNPLKQAICQKRPLANRFAPRFWHATQSDRRSAHSAFGSILPPIPLKPALARPDEGAFGVLEARIPSLQSYRSK